MPGVRDDPKHPTPQQAGRFRSFYRPASPFGDETMMLWLRSEIQMCDYPRCCELPEAGSVWCTKHRVRLGKNVPLALHDARERFIAADEDRRAKSLLMRTVALAAVVMILMALFAVVERVAGQ
jgi:hypothetical protein